MLTAVPDGRMFALDQQMLISIIIQLINVALLAMALTFILYKPVRNYLINRTERIYAQMTYARDDVTKAGELKAEYEKKLEEISLERTAILDETNRLATENRGLVLSEAQQEVSAMKARASADIQIEREHANEDIRLQMIEIASFMAEKFVTLSLDAETQDKLFEETLAELEGVVWQD